ERRLERLPLRSVHPAGHRGALPRRALRRDRPAARVAAHERRRATEGRARDRSREGLRDRRHHPETDRPILLPRGASRRRRQHEVPLSRQDPRRRRGRPRAPLARHRAPGGRGLARHQLPGDLRMTRMTLAWLVAALLAGPAWSLTGREVIDGAQKKNGLSTWHDRVLTATMTTYSNDVITRSRDMDITEQTDPRG